MLKGQVTCGLSVRLKFQIGGVSSQTPNLSVCGGKIRYLQQLIASQHNYINARDGQRSSPNNNSDMRLHLRAIVHKQYYECESDKLKLFILMKMAEKCKIKSFFKYSEDELNEAMKFVRDGGKIREAGRKFNVPHSTLLNKLKNRVPIARKMGPPTILTQEEEEFLCRWIAANAKKGIPLNKRMLIETVGGRAEEFRLSYDKGWEGDESAKELFHVWKKLRTKCIGEQTETSVGISNSLTGIINQEEHLVRNNCYTKNGNTSDKELERVATPSKSQAGEPIISTLINSSEVTPTRSDKTKKNYISPSFLDHILWPTESPQKSSKRKKKERLPHAATSKKWLSYWEDKEKVKEQKEENKRNKVMARQQKKDQKEKDKVVAAKKKRKVIKHDTSSETEEEEEWTDSGESLLSLSDTDDETDLQSTTNNVTERTHDLTYQYMKVELVTFLAVRYGRFLPMKIGVELNGATIDELMNKPLEVGLDGKYALCLENSHKLSQEVIKEMFSKYGEVHSIRYVGQTLVFIRYYNFDDASACLNDLSSTYSIHPARTKKKDDTQERLPGGDNFRRRSPGEDRFERRSPVGDQFSRSSNREYNTAKSSARPQTTTSSTQTQHMSPVNYQNSSGVGMGKTAPLVEQEQSVTAPPLDLFLLPAPFCRKHKASTSFLLYDCSKISPEHKGTRLLRTCYSAVCDRDEEQGYFGPVPALPVTERRGTSLLRTCYSVYLIRGAVTKRNSSFRLSGTGCECDVRGAVTKEQVISPAIVDEQPPSPSTLPSYSKSACSSGVVGHCKGFSQTKISSPAPSVKPGLNCCRLLFSLDPLTFFLVQPSEIRTERLTTGGLQFFRVIQDKAMLRKLGTKHLPVKILQI
uniref:HTH psq-type domain-containing protein n=1 Tax=Timema tahoe TaxID=61484 RepID=A0A7R9NVK7_9NEOP|nr:unnamed protein product [Timema tahoe]